MSERPTKPISTWDLFKNHRGIVTELICSEATNDRGSLCILGAGPCYGIDLGLLLSKFDRITLVDLDTATLRAGVSAQQVNNSSRLRLIGGLDLAKNQLRLEQYSRQPSREGLQRLLE